MLECTSPSPSIVLLSSVASLIPAPTRALYAATKSAALLFFQSLSIEHPAIVFSSVLPASIEGDFRSTAVDTPVSSTSAVTGNKEGQDEKKAKTEKKLKRDTVAQACIDTVDYGTKVVWLPGWYRIAHALYWIWPALIERGARKKYGYTV
jgi:short-subunit dehydrogenase